MSGLELRDYQLGALRAIDDGLARGVRRQLLSLPTGTGKTVVFSKAIERAGGAALVLAHRDELLQQAAEKIALVAPELGLGIGFVQAGRNDVGAPIVVASVQTLARQARLEQLPRTFRRVIVDEAHHAASASYQRILEHVSESELVVGFTATPERTDKLRLEDTFDEIVFARGLLEMIEAGYLCNLRGIRVDLELELDRVKSSAGDFQAADLGRALDDADVVPHSVAAWLEHGERRPTLAFVPTVELSQRLAAAFVRAGVKAAHIDGTTPADDRRRILDELRAGDLELVSNVNVLTEGFDEPSIGCVLVATPTKSRIRYVQMIGRGTRLYPGKDDCLVLDLAGVTDDLSVESLPGIFGLDELEDGELVTEGIERRDRARRSALEHQAAEEAKVKPAEGQEVDLFRRDRLRWLDVDRGRWLLSVGRDTDLLLERQDAGDFRVVRLRGSGYRILARGLDLGYAQGVAEKYVREEEAVALADSRAAWRKKPPSPKQINLARKLAITTSIESTAGDVADAIALKFARRRLERFDRAVGNASDENTANR